MPGENPQHRGEEQGAGRRVVTGMTAARSGADGEAGGEAACWAHLVCPECGAVTGEDHRDGCELGPPLAAR